MKKDNIKKVYIINYNTIIYAIIFLILVLGSIYFMYKCMGNTDVTIQSSGVYDVDQANTINAVANNVIGRINNTIAVSAIFFTVIVASISVFQFIKIKDLDNITKKVIEESEDIKDKSNETKEELEKTKNEFKLLKVEYEKLDYLRRDLEKKSSIMQVDFNMHKINYILDSLKYNHKSFSNLELRNLIVKTIILVDKYPGVISNVEKARLQFMQLKYYDALGVDYISSVEELYKILDNIKNEECDDLKLNIYKTMIGLVEQYNDVELYKEIIQKMGTSMDGIIEEIITNTTYAYYSIDISEIEKTYNELADFFGSKFIEILTKETKKEYFKEVLESKEFKDFFIKFIDQRIDESKSSEE